MKCQIEFTSKDFDKTIVLEFQDDKIAKQWAEKQLEVWKRKARITITPILIETKEEPEVKPKKKKKAKKTEQTEQTETTA